MKVCDVFEFEKRLEESNYEYGFLNDSPPEVEHDFEQHEFEIQYVSGILWQSIELDGVLLDRLAGFRYPVGNPSDGEISALGETGNFKFDIKVIDEDGDLLSDAGIIDLILRHTSVDEFTVDMLGDRTFEEIDLTDENSAHIVRRDCDLDFKFNGKLLARSESHTTAGQGCEFYSGNSWEHDELELYQTSNGQFVCAKNRYTGIDGKRHTYHAIVNDNLAEVVNFFGTTPWALHLYDKAGIGRGIIDAKRS